MANAENFSFYKKIDLEGAIYYLQINGMSHFVRT
jgi:hypothetical protein